MDMDMNDLRQQVLYLRDVLGLSFRQIAGRIGIGRKRLSRIYSGAWKGVPVIRGSRLDLHRDLIEHWFRECMALKAIQIHHRLAERGVTIHPSTVARYTRAFRKKPGRRIFWPLEFLPGEEAQVDWFFVAHPRLGKLCGFAMVLSFSRFLFAHLFPRHSFEFFIEGHLMACRAFGGCPRALRYDNLKSVVTSRQPLVYNSAFLEFARHIGFEIRLCNVAAGNEKGRVERVIRSMRETFFNDTSSHQSLKALNAALHEWADRKNRALHRATGVLPIDKMKEEKLKPLPQIPWCNTVILPPRKPSKIGLVPFDANAYSVPHHMGFQEIVIHASVDRVGLFSIDGNPIASHQRSFEKSQKIINPLHRSISTLSAPAKRERILAIIRAMDPAVAAFLDAHRIVGEDPFTQAHQLFSLLRTNGRHVVLSAVREAVARGSPRIATVRSMIEPAPHSQTADVSPQRKELLDIDYQSRSLKDYDDKDR